MSENPRLARIAPDEIAAIEQLILRSKAQLGYEAEMMAVMARVLRLDRSAIEDGRAIAAWIGEAPAGVVQISPPYNDARGGAVALDLLFIGHGAIGTGLGRTLYDWAVEQARAAGALRLDILSDPNAAPFYAAMGAVHVEDRPCEVIPGRMLPRLEHRLD